MLQATQLQRREFGTDVVVSDSAALKNGTSSNDSQYGAYLAKLQQLGAQRDAVAASIKYDRFQAKFNNTPLPSATGQLSSCNSLLDAANNLVSP